MMTKGMKSSEFHVLIGSMVMTYLNSRYGWAIDPLAIFGMFTGSGVYAVARTMAKKK